MLKRHSSGWIWQDEGILWSNPHWKLLTMACPRRLTELIGMLVSEESCSETQTTQTSKQTNKPSSPVFGEASPKLSDLSMLFFFQVIAVNLMFQICKSCSQFQQPVWVSRIPNSWKRSLNTYVFTFLWAIIISQFT